MVIFCIVLYCTLSSSFSYSVNEFLFNAFSHTRSVLIYYFCCLMLYKNRWAFNLEQIHKYRKYRRSTFKKEMRDETISSSRWFCVCLVELCFLHLLSFFFVVMTWRFFSLQFFSTTRSSKGSGKEGPKLTRMWSPSHHHFHGTEIVGHNLSLSFRSSFSLFKIYPWYVGVYAVL